jgi:hypothetical protein
MHDLEHFHKSIGRLLAEREIPAWSAVIKLERIHEWAGWLSKHGIGDPDTTNEHCRESYRVLAESQMMIGHCLLIVERDEYQLRGGRLVLGRGAEPKFTLDDFYLCLYLGFLWESLYRAWERYSLLLRSVFVPDMLPDSSYYPQTIARLKADFPALRGLKGFRNLEEATTLRKTVADRRNRLTHRASSLFANLADEFEVSRIVDLTGEPYLVGDVDLLDAGQELNDGIVQYKELGRILMGMHEFFQECVDSGVLTRRV